MKSMPLVLLVSVFALASCKKEESTLETVEENVKDALDAREHEEMKDAAEDAEDAVKDALDAREHEKAKDAVEEAEEALEDITE